MCTCGGLLCFCCEKVKLRCACISVGGRQSLCPVVLVHPTCGQFTAPLSSCILLHRSYLCKVQIKHLKIWISEGLVSWNNDFGLFNCLVGSLKTAYIPEMDVGQLLVSCAETFKHKDETFASWANTQREKKRLIESQRVDLLIWTWFVGGAK